MEAKKENAMVPEIKATPTRERKPIAKRRLFKLDDNDRESVSDFIDRKIKEHSEIERKTFKDKYNYDPVNDKPSSASDNFKWITATTAPQFYHETTAKSKSERRDTLNDVEKPPSTDACNKRLLDTDSVVAQPVRKQPKLGLSQRPANRRVKQGETKPVEKAIGIPIITATAKATATTTPAPII